MIPSTRAKRRMERTVYQRGVVIDSQLFRKLVPIKGSISKGSGD